MQTPPLLYSRITQTWLSQKPDANGFLLAALITAFLAMGSLIYWQDWLHAFSWMSASRQDVFNHHQIWKAFSTLFAHADEKHLLSNSFLFFILGGFLAGHFGRTLFPVLAFLFGGITNFIVLSYMPPEVKLIGASGMVYWMGGAWLALYFALDIKRSFYQRTIRASGVALMLFFPAQAFEPQISYMSHFVGFILGVLAGIGFYFFNKSTFDQAIQREIIVDQ